MLNLWERVSDYVLATAVGSGAGATLGYFVFDFPLRMMRVDSQLYHDLSLGGKGMLIGAAVGGLAGIVTEYLTNGNNST